MFRAILFDLDGTLLKIDMDEFLKHYFNAMAEMARLSGYQEHRQLVEQVFASTWVMIANRDPRLTNEQVFKDHFYSFWPHLQDDLEAFFERFYREGFPRLRNLCQPIAGIPELMQALLQRKVKIAIATNAVFPLTALQQRLTWAGLDPAAFDLITSYEVMHFCKPHLEYYQEICDKLQVQPGDCLMVGNDMGEDMVAQKLGMKTYLIEDYLIDPGETGLKPDWRGRMPDFLVFAAKCCGIAGAAPSKAIRRKTS
jgi:FMN phosphatase YigB (HAD superfamily)